MSVKSKLPGVRVWALWDGESFCGAHDSQDAANYWRGVLKLPRKPVLCRLVPEAELRALLAGGKK